MILVDLERVAARRPDRPLFEDLSLSVSSGDRLGVVGRNGTGKSTLLGVLAGAGRPEEGTVRRSRHVRTGFLGQRPQLPAGDVGSAVGSGWEAAAILERLGMGGMAGADVDTLSGGQAKRVALARVLVEEVDLLVLDEPTNHLDIDAIAWLEQRLAGFRGGLVVVTHDRHVLDRVTTRILELDRGRGHVHEGGYGSYLEAVARRAGQEARAESVRRNLARAELAWLRRGAPARTRKPKARVTAATAVVEARAPAPDRPGPLDLAGGGQWGATPRLGDKVVGLHGVGHRFGDGPWLFAGVDLDLGPGQRLGLVGPNGAGKSTLLDLVAGRLAPEAGAVVLGPTVRLGYYDQAGRRLDPHQRVRQAVAGAQAEPSWEQVRLMERLWFDADAQWAPVGTLSGGEQRRLQLLLVLAGLPNVLLLDEPTNDLDLDTLRALEDHLEAWPGTVVVASHDRAFLERTVEDVVVLDGHGRAVTPAGGYAGWAASRARSGAGSGGGARALPARRPGPEPAPAPATGAHRSQAGADPAGAGDPSRPGPAPAAAGARPPAGAAPTAGARTAPGPDPATTPPRRRSASTLRRLQAQLDRELAEAEAERDRLAAALAAGAADHTVVAGLAHALAGAEARLAAAEERWLALAEELERP